MKHSGFTMAKVRQIPADLDGFCCTIDDSCSGIDRVKNSSYANSIAGAFNPAVTIADFFSPWFLAVFA